MTVTPVNTVQHCSPCPLDPEPSSSVYVKLESSEGKMGPELKELESPSAGTGLETPGQQCPPNEGTREQGRTFSSGFLTAGVGSSQAGKKSSPTDEENKQFDPGGRGEKAPPWNAAVTLLSFSGESWEAPCLCCVILCLCFVCVCFLNYCFFQVITSQRAERHEGRRGSSR